MKKISVIVPVYNAAKTIDRCVKSIMNQSYSNLEIILVDDASKDDSREHLIALEKLDPDRILVICNDNNSGPGGARNIGLQYVSGEYVGFVDSDDHINPLFYEKMINEMEEGEYDIVDSGYYNEAQDTAILHTGRNERGILNDAQRCELIVSGGYLWSRLYRMELFDDICFRENCILEDSEVLVELIAKARSAGAVEETMYWYSSSPSSASNVRDPGKYIINICAAMDALASLKNKIDNYNALKPAIDYEIIQLYDYGIVMALKDAKTDRKLDTIPVLKHLRQIRSYSAQVGYDNIYVQKKIEEADLKIMKDNDEDPEVLCRLMMR